MPPRSCACCHVQSAYARRGRERKKCHRRTRHRPGQHGSSPPAVCGLCGRHLLAAMLSPRPRHIAQAERTVVVACVCGLCACPRGGGGGKGGGGGTWLTTLGARWLGWLADWPSCCCCCCWLLPPRRQPRRTETAAGSAKYRLVSSSFPPFLLRHQHSSERLPPAPPHLHREPSQLPSALIERTQGRHHGSRPAGTSHSGAV